MLSIFCFFAWRVVIFVILLLDHWWHTIFPWSRVPLKTGWSRDNVISKYNWYYFRLHVACPHLPVRRLSMSVRMGFLDTKFVPKILALSVSNLVARLSSRILNIFLWDFFCCFLDALEACKKNMGCVGNRSLDFKKIIENHDVDFWNESTLNWAHFGGSEFEFGSSRNFFARLQHDI